MRKRLIKDRVAVKIQDLAKDCILRLKVFLKIKFFLAFYLPQF